MKRMIHIIMVAMLLPFASSASSYEVQTMANIALTEKISGISAHPQAGTAIAVSTETRSLYEIDTLTNTVIKKISLPAIPSGVAVDSKRNQAIVSSEEGVLYFIDLKTDALSKTITVDKAIHALAVNKVSDTLYLGSHSSLITIGLETGTVFSQTSIAGVVIGIDVDDTLGQLLLISVPAISEPTKPVVYLLDSGTLKTIGEIKVGKSPFGIAISPSTKIAVLTNYADSSISIVSLTDKLPVAIIPFYEQPGAVSIDPMANTALIAHKGGIAIVKLESPLPRIDTLVPESATAGEPGFSLSIKGEGFIKNSTVRFDTKELVTSFQDYNHLQAQVPSSEIEIPKEASVSVINPPPGGGMSNASSFRVYTPAPIVESLAPDTISLKSLPVTLKVYGKNFLPGSFVNLDGNKIKARFRSSILLEVDLNPSDIKSSGRYIAIVTNPLPGTFASNPVYLNVVEDVQGAFPIPAGTLTGSSGQKAGTTTSTFTGRILNTQKEPVEGVTVQIKNVKAVTDSNGYFVFTGVPTGKQQLMIHGSTAMDTGSFYPTIPLTVDIGAGGITEMPYQVYLHKQKNWNFKEINPNEDTILTDPELPGFEMRIPKGVKITGWDGRPKQRVSVRTVPPDRLPVKPLPPNAFVRTVYMFYFDTIGGGIPDQPIPVKSPNDLGLLPGEKAILWYYDESPNEGEAPNDWAIAGTGTVTRDGKFIVSDPGVGIPKFCCGATAWGGTSIGTDGTGPDDCGLAGDPVDVATGYFLHSKTDLFVPGIIPVSMTRYYRSGDLGLGLFGKGTYFEYDWWLAGGTYQEWRTLIKPGNYQYRFHRQTDGTFINTTDPAVRGAVITDNADGTRTLRMRDGWAYKFDASGDMIEVADRNGNKLTFGRRPDFEGGYLTTITTQEGRTVSLSQSYWGSFFVTDSITDSAGRTVRYAYETDPFFSQYPRLKSVVYPDGSTVEYQYDFAGRMSGFVNEKGVLEVFNEYDANNRVIRQTHSDGGIYQFSYTMGGGYITETSMTAPDGSVKTWRFYDDTGAFRDKYITQETTSDGTIRREREVGTNQVLSVTDPLGRATSYTYYSSGLVHTMTDNLGNVTTYEYDPTYGLPTKITDPLGNFTTISYDPKGNLTSITDSLGHTTTMSYNPMGRPITVTDPLGNITTLGYDATGNLTTITNPLSHVSTMSYDGLGRPITLTDANGSSTLYEYDVMGRIAAVTDPNGRATRYVYDKGGKLTQVTDAKGHSVWYGYDDRGRATLMMDSRVRTETYAHDTSDHLVSVTDRKGQVTTYTYDSMGRVTRAGYADGSYTSYTYDVAGRLTAITDSPSGMISYAYSNSGCGTGCSGIEDRVIQETTPLGTINYAYDAAGRRTSMTVAGQPAVNYSYDAAGRLTGINATINGSPSSFGLSYDAASRRTSLTYPNGVSTSYAYDSADRLSSLEHRDPLNQILESLGYTYDAVGNRISLNRPAVSLPVHGPVSNTAFDATNEMLTFSDKNMTHDENGSLTSVTNGCGTTTYSWDARNRLVGISGFDSNCQALTASFQYDALNRRIGKTINGVTTQFAYDGLDIIQEKQNGAVTANYIRTLQIDEPLARIKADGTVRYYQADALGSVIALVDDAGVVKTTYSYDPFGNVTVTGESSDNPLQYTGRENDETGLYYYRARFYSAGLQRFISEDPIRFAGGDVNFYAYVGNNPVNKKDPLGLEYGTDSCAYYDQMCDETGSLYYCNFAKAVCNLVDLPDTNWDQCVRQCLQEFDDELCQQDPCKKSGFDYTCTFADAHAYCFVTCFTNSNDRPGWLK